MYSNGAPLIRLRRRHQRHHWPRFTSLHFVAPANCIERPLQQSLDSSVIVIVYYRAELLNEGSSIGAAKGWGGVRARGGIAGAAPQYSSAKRWNERNKAQERTRGIEKDWAKEKNAIRVGEQWEVDACARQVQRHYAGLTRHSITMRP